MSSFWNGLLLPLLTVRPTPRAGSGSPRFHLWFVLGLCSQRSCVTAWCLEQGCVAFWKPNWHVLWGLSLESFVQGFTHPGRNGRKKKSRFFFYFFFLSLESRRTIKYMKIFIFFFKIYSAKVKLPSLSCEFKDRFVRRVTYY